jgi:hypothetical protein
VRFLLFITALAGITWVTQRFRRRQLSVLGAGAWIALWILVGAVALQPEWTNRLADILGIGRGADVVLYGAIIVIVALLFRMSVRIEQLDRAITTVTRELALRERDPRESHGAPVSKH